jgi:hypothetical protein
VIVVNPATRQFNIPGADLVFGVTADANSAVKHFQCPRYVGNNVDIASSFVRINYQNAHGDIDFYLVNDVTVDGDNVTFSWELHPKVTMYRGNVSFVMCVTGPDAKVKWHTTLGRGQVLEGLEPDNALVETDTKDGIAALIAMVEDQTVEVEKTGADQVAVVKAAAKTAQDGAVAQIEANGKNVMESIPDDYTSLGNAVDGLVRGRAGAIVCEVEGSAVAVKDASDMAIQGMRIFGRSAQDGIPTPDSPVEIVSVENPVVTVCGKNILPYPYDETSASQNGMTLMPQEGGGIAVSGTPTGYVDIYLYDGPPLAKNGNVTISIHGVFENVTASLGFHDAIGTTIGSVNAIPEGRNYIAVNLDDYPTAIRWVVLIKRVNNNQPVSGVVYPQIELGEIATEYKPYTGNTIETTNPIRGIPVTSGGNYTDENGQQWICDEMDLERGVYVQRIATKTLTEADITSVGSGYFEYGTYAYTTVRDAKAISTDVVVISDKLLGIRADQRSGFIYDSNYRCYAQDGVVYLRFPAGTGEKTLSECKTTFAGTTVQYALATPVETPLSETEIAAYRALHSNYPNTTVLNNSGAHMVVMYAADTKLYIDNKIAALIGGV